MTWAFHIELLLIMNGEKLSLGWVLEKSERIRQEKTYTFFRMVKKFESKMIATFDIWREEKGPNYIYMAPENKTGANRLKLQEDIFSLLEGIIVQRWTILLNVVSSPLPGMLFKEKLLLCFKKRHWISDWAGYNLIYLQALMLYNSIKFDSNGKS